VSLYWDGRPAAKIYDVVGYVAGSLRVSSCALCRIHFRLVSVSSNILLRMRSRFGSAVQVRYRYAALAVKDEKRRCRNRLGFNVVRCALTKSSA